MEFGKTTLNRATALLVTLLAPPVSAQTEVDPALRLVPCGDQTCVAARLPADVTEEDRSRVLAVRTEASATAEPPGSTLFGTYSLDGPDLVFRPRLPFLPGTRYRATIHLPTLEHPLDLTFELPAESTEPPRVVAIHPSSTTVPANLLRAYVEFSRSMRPDVVADYLHLVDESGKEVALPFVEIDGGLWDPNGTRLTLIFHPGRLKRGVAPRQEQGPPLESGKAYRLRVDAGWPAVDGELLSESIERGWTVAGDDREPVTPSTWELQSPRAGTDDRLQIDFGEPLDHALALRLIEVQRAGEAVPGQIELSADDTRWNFRPESPWVDDDHTVQIHPALEDLAGNNLRGPFDRGEGQGEKDATPTQLTFRPET